MQRIGQLVALTLATVTLGSSAVYLRCLSAHFLSVGEELLSSDKTKMGFWQVKRRPPSASTHPGPTHCAFSVGSQLVSPAAAATLELIDWLLSPSSVYQCVCVC